MSNRVQIPLWRKLLYAAVVVLLLLGLAEGVVRLLWQEPPLPRRQGIYPSLRIYIDATRHMAVQQRLHLEGPLPGPEGPEVLWRVPMGTPGAVDFVGGGGVYKLVRPSRLPAGRRVLVFGGSAAWGPSFDYPRTFPAVVQQRLRRRLGDDSIQVLNLARPGWELNRVKALLLRVVHQLRPAAVILLSGNNELLHVRHLEEVGMPRPNPLALYRLTTHLLRNRGWLPPPRGTNPDAITGEQAEPYSAAQVSRRIWRPGRGLDDASHWLHVRQAYLAQYRLNLELIKQQLAKLGVPLVLVPPPINLHYFPGGLRSQPATFARVGAAGYHKLCGRLERALEDATGRQLKALIKEHPSGPLQHFMLGQLHDAAGRRRQAYLRLMAGRDRMMGFLESLPSMTEAAVKLRGPGLKVIDTRAWYRDPRSIRETAVKLFVDSCHLTDDGHARLAGMLSSALEQLWN